MRGHEVWRTNNCDCAESHFWASSCQNVFIACRERAVAKKLIRILRKHEEQGRVRFVKEELSADLVIGDRADIILQHKEGENKRCSYYLFAGQKPLGFLPTNVTIYKKDLFLEETTVFQEFFQDSEI